MPPDTGCADLQTHRKLVVDALLKGRVVPFLGAGVNLCDRPSQLAWHAPDPAFLPSGRELAEYLAGKFHFPLYKCFQCPGDVKPDLDLARVSQYSATLLDEGPLNDELRTVFEPSDPKFQPTSVHRFLGRIHALNPDRPEDRNFLIVTTNYDDLMEQVLGEGNFDLVFYVASEQPRPSFWHKPPNAKPCKIKSPNTYPYEFFKDRPVVLKIHGTIDRTDRNRESFVITEDQYIQYLAEEPLEKLLPPRLLGKMRGHHLLFFGYGLRDWNFRVFLRRLKRSEKQGYRPWAVLLNPDEVERKFWEQNHVDIINVDLKVYIEELDREWASR